MPVRFITADVFTDQVFGGNQLAVFPDARSIDAALMQSITQNSAMSRDDQASIGASQARQGTMPPVP